MYPVDLHLHTTASDGWWSPSELVRRAAKAGLNVISVTDHDTIAGVAEAKASAESTDVDVVEGVELSVSCEGQEVHLLGYFFDANDEQLNRYLDEMIEAREERAHRIVQRLQELDVDVEFRQVKEVAAGGILGRPHVAQALVEAGEVETMQEAFDRFLKDGGAAFVAKPERPAARALELLHQAGGIGVLAHPGHWTRLATISTLVGHGLDGIEVSHPSHDRGLTRYYERKARQFGLCPSGGSDVHGREDEETALGKYGLSIERYSALTKRAL